MFELKVHDEDREVVLVFEHSLLALSKWEGKTKKAFLTNAVKSNEELIDYFQDMLVSPEGAQDLVYVLDPEQLDSLTNYMNSSQTASTVPQEPIKYNPEVTTSELIYYWLVGLKIPFHPVETWHISRLMMLVQITSFKQQPPKKQKNAEIMSKWREINEERKKKYHTEG